MSQREPARRRIRLSVRTLRSFGRGSRQRRRTSDDYSPRRRNRIVVELELERLLGITRFHRRRHWLRDARARNRRSRIRSPPQIMKRTAQLVASTCIAITLFFSGEIARADLTPPPLCASTAKVGDACSSNDEPGSCVRIGDCEVDAEGKSPAGCLSCEPGAPPPKDAGTDGGTTTTTTTTTTSSSSSGCTASPDAREGTVGLVMLAFGFLGLLVSRKKSA
jgi:hypothetical protein